jgi:hypothetical protein
MHLGHDCRRARAGLEAPPKSFAGQPKLLPGYSDAMSRYRCDRCRAAIEPVYEMTNPIAGQLDPPVARIQLGWRCTNPECGGQTGSPHTAKPQEDAGPPNSQTIPL